MEELPIELELRKLGLNKKEARVYLAGLELGATSVQNIAKKAGLPRPTTYEIIKALKEKKLFTETKEKKKTLILAQSPDRILGMLRMQKREIEEKEREFIRIIAALEAKFSKKEEGIKIYKGKEGLEVLEEILSFSSVSNIVVVNPKSVPIKKERLNKIFQGVKKRLGKLEIKEITAEVKGSLIIFDKIILFPYSSQSSEIKAFLFLPGSF